MKITGVRLEFFIDSPQKRSGGWKLPTEASMRRVEQEYGCDLFMEQNGLHVIFDMEGSKPSKFATLAIQAVEAGRKLTWK